MSKNRFLVYKRKGTNPTVYSNLPLEKDKDGNALENEIFGYVPLDKWETYVEHYNMMNQARKELELTRTDEVTASDPDFIDADKLEKEEQTA